MWSNGYGQQAPPAPNYPGPGYVVPPKPPLRAPRDTRLVAATITLTLLGVMTCIGLYSTIGGGVLATAMVMIPVAVFTALAAMKALAGDRAAIGLAVAALSCQVVLYAAAVTLDIVTGLLSLTFLGHEAAIVGGIAPTALLVALIASNGRGHNGSGFATQQPPVAQQPGFGPPQTTPPPQGGGSFPYPNHAPPGQGYRW